MQPCYEALSLGRMALGDIPIPALVSQIADGENGGVMMNEFPQAFLQAHRKLTGEGGRTAAINGTEYLELLEAAGVTTEAYPRIQAVQQHKLWQRLDAPTSPEAVQAAIGALQASDPSFSMAGASWTNNLSWVEGYTNVLEPMNRLSAAFHQRFDAPVAADPAVTRSQPYQQALLQLLLLQTSCFRYWGQGTWTDYATEIYRRGEAALSSSML
jgi:hypothetical protein